MDQGDTPDFKSAPASLRDALKEYYESLDGKFFVLHYNHSIQKEEGAKERVKHLYSFYRIYSRVSNARPKISKKIYLGKKSGTVSPTTPVSQSERDRVIEQEKKLYEQFSKNVDISGSNLLFMYF